MNERIEELSKQAEIYALTLVGREDDYVEVFEQKFAELIVKDCISVAVEAKSNGVARMIRLKFGVEE